MLTIPQAMQKWGRSRATIRRWIAQGRLNTTQPGRDILILDENPPAPAAQGSLSPFQRKAWQK
jgi:excisionase family DNA binding protein